MGGGARLNLFFIWHSFPTCYDQSAQLGTAKPVTTQPRRSMKFLQFDHFFQPFFDDIYANSMNCGDLLSLMQKCQIIESLAVASNHLTDSVRQSAFVDLLLTSVKQFIMGEDLQR